ncbi:MULTISPECIES: hypothetical protein [Streptococcus]|uniref:Uncharacterized protein n=1 Tax=Streptococcus caledonicus TaxID=2614158 RepID=A0ABW0UBP8_9STRE|nr:hypothetical protein [Streptococcus sp. S784/96/1]
MNVAIYFKNGSTAYFQQVENFHGNQENIKFTYFGLSSQERKQAVFYKDSIAGLARTVVMEAKHE